MTKFKMINKIVSLVLVLSIFMMLIGCSSAPPQPVLSDPNPKVITENIITENIITENIVTENILHEFITTEIYLEEIVLAENKITELLLEDDSVSEVMCCKTIYVPQEHIDDFVDNSQTKQLFGEGINVKSVLTKMSVGTGLIVTITILSKVKSKGPIASVIVAAADKSLEFAEDGAVIGSLFGALTGASDVIDETGRTSAVIGFAFATAGLILSIISLASAVPSGGALSLSAVQGVKLVIAGIDLITMSALTIDSGYNAIKTFTSTDSIDIDWNNIDWDKVGVSSAEKAIENAADGYMWGAFVGTVHGGVEGYEYYHKYSTPYTNYEKRIDQLKRMKKGLGKWTGDIGESTYVLNDPIVLPNGTKITKVKYKNAVPDFSPYAIAEVKVKITGDRTSNKSHGIVGNYEKADSVLAEQWTKKKYKGKSWSARDVANYRSENNLTWHEMSNMESMQLVPTELNATFKHYGGVAEYNAMIGQEGVTDFD